MKVDGSYESLLQGVSQQPARTRLPGQCTEQINFTANPVKGLTRRGGTQFVSYLFNSASDAAYYDFKIGSTNYELAIVGSDVYVYNVETGLPETVVIAGGSSYLSGKDYAFTDIDGTVYIANRSKTVEMLSTTASYVATGAIVFLLGGQYGRKYTIDIAWSGTAISVNWTAPDGGSSSHSTQVATDYIATQLATALNANATFTANFSVTRVSDVLYIQKTSSPATESFKVSVTDGDGGINMIAVNNSTKDVDKLPRFAPQDYVVHVIGDKASGADDWYLRFQCDPDSAGAVPAMGAGFGREGTWVECVAPGIPYLLDTSTMPHTLVYDTTTSTFTYDAGDWLGRRVGDETTNENPSFVGKNVEDLFYFQGRFGMLAGASAIMSRTEESLDFFKKSATALLDTDPIDISSTAKGAAGLLRAIPFNRDLVIFGEGKAQFTILGRNTLTPDNASIVLSTTFEADLDVDPVAAGKNIFFGITYGQFAGIREFFADSNIDTNDSRPITQHVLEYIRGNVDLMVTSSNMSVLYVKTDEDPDTLYMYEYIWADTQKVQSAFSKYIFPFDIEEAFLVGSKLYLIFKVGTQRHLEYLDTDIRRDTGLTYHVLVDSKRIEPLVTGNIVTVPSELDPAQCVFVTGANHTTPGLTIPVDTIVGQTVYFADTLSGSDVIYGERFRSTYEPTMPMVKDAEGVKVGTATLIVSKFLVNYEESGFMETHKISEFRDPIIVPHTTIRVGDPFYGVGAPPIKSGTWVVPFRDNADNATMVITTDSHLPLTLTSLEWLGQYMKRGKRITGGSK